jgi:peptide/nickel transport system substrate-binding protein
MRPRLSRRSACLALVLTAVLSAAGTTAAGSGTTEPITPSTEPLVVAIGQDIPHLDIRLPGGAAATHSALRHITEPLVFFDAEGQELQGVLAESWEQVEPLRWRFKLREGVTFHNGDPFNADAVVYSIAQAIDPEFDVWFRYGTGGVLGPAEKVDDYTVDITTEVEAPLLPNLLTVVDMVSPNVSLEEQNSHPIGTGPYQFDSYQLNDRLVVDRFDDYWKGPEAYPGIIFRIIPETSTRVQALLAGEVSGINGIGVEDIERIDADEATKVIGAPQVQHVLISLRGDRPPLDNPLIREAMNYAVDKELITSTILSGIALPADGFLPPGLPGAQNDLGPWPFDPDKARELMEEAGYDGEEITFGVGEGRYPSDGDVGLAVAAMLEDVGFNINYVATDYATYTTETELREGSSYDIFLSSWIADFGDSASMMDAFFGGVDSPIPAFYVNDEYQAASEEAKTAPTLDARVAAIQKMENIVWEDAAALFLYFPIENYGVAENLEGFEARVDGFFYFYGTHLA